MKAALKQRESIWRRRRLSPPATASQVINVAIFPPSLQLQNCSDIDVTLLIA